MRRALGLAIALGAVACRGRDEATIVTAAPTTSVSAEAPALPIDHLELGELGEGTDHAFGLTLPRTFVITRTFDDAIFAEGPAGVERVANYVRRRVEPPTFEMGPARTIFDRVKPKGGDRLVKIEITERSGDTELVVRDLTPPPTPAGLSDEERWKRVGLTPQGKVPDPDRSF